MATIKDIARIANVSPSTVSFVLNGKAREMKVSSATEQRILEIVAEGFPPLNHRRLVQAANALPGQEPQQGAGPGNEQHQRRQEASDIASRVELPAHCACHHSMRILPDCYRKMRKYFHR